MTPICQKQRDTIEKEVGGRKGEKEGKNGRGGGRKKGRKEGRGAMIPVGAQKEMITVLAP